MILAASHGVLEKYRWIYGISHSHSCTQTTTSYQNARIFRFQHGAAHPPCERPKTPFPACTDLLGRHNMPVAFASRCISRRASPAAKYAIKDAGVEVSRGSRRCGLRKILVSFLWWTMPKLIYIGNKPVVLAAARPKGFDVAERRRNMKQHQAICSKHASTIN